jgi:uncharacterized protein YndB with AHSA1/START domain
MNVNVQSTIQKPIHEVYEAIVDPKKITGYFVSHASAPMEADRSITWEFSDYNVSFDIKVLEVMKDQRVSFEWDVEGKMVVVTISLTPISEKVTQIDITESSYLFTETDVAKAMGQTQGWTDFICSLKAYLYTGINLRNGSYP